MKKTVFLIICSVLFFSCAKNDPTEKQSPIESEMETEEPFDVLNFDLEIEVFEKGGVVLEAISAELEADKISEFGFLISQLKNPNFANSRVIESDELIDNMFSQTVEDDLDFNVEYHVVAYIKQGEEYTYTKVKSFVSTGSKAPEIISVAQAHIGDTLEIKGLNFTSIQNRTKVLFDEEIATVLQSSDTIIRCIVPKTLKKFDPKVKVDLFSKSADFEAFSLFKPIIESLSATSVSIGDTLTVYGKHFDLENERNSIAIEEKQAEILLSSRDSITFVLPQPLSFSNNTFTLTSQLQDVESELSFSIRPPVISEIPLSFRSYETIEFTGDEFSSIAEDNIVLFDNHQATVIEASKTKLKVRVPIGPYEDQNPALQIKIMDYVFQFEDNLEFIDTWLLYRELEENHFTHFISNDDSAYIFIEDDTNARFIVRVLDSNLSLTSSFHVDYPRTSMKDEQFAVLYNKDSNRVFFYFAEEEEHNFYEFLKDNRTLVERTNYPDTERSGPVIFTIDGMIYMGLGNYPTSNSYPDYEPFSHFWRYDDQTDSWTQVADFLGNINRRRSSVFVIDKEGYVGNGATSTGHYDFWKFSPTNNEWVRIDNFPDNRKNTASFEYNGNGYVVFGGWLSSLDDVFKYVPSLDDWFKMEEVNEFFFQDYGRSPELTTILKFSNAIYLIVSKYPNDLCFKVDLDKL